MLVKEEYGPMVSYLWWLYTFVYDVLFSVSIQTVPRSLSRHEDAKIRDLSRSPKSVNSESIPIPDLSPSQSETGPSPLLRCLEFEIKLFGGSFLVVSGSNTRNI